MNKKEKPSKGRRSAAVGIAICFIAAVAMVGTYTLREYQKSQNDEQNMTEDAENTQNETKEPSEEANTDKLVIDQEDDEEDADGQDTDDKDEAGTSDAQNTQGQSGSSVSRTAGQSIALNFTEDSQLLWPVNGNVLLNYSMDKTVYFSTLDQYKYNPALIISGAEGDQVICGAAGVVKSIDVTAQTGTTVNVDLGNGYELLYGQLKEVPVQVGDYVAANSVIGYVSQPTKYYSVEGCNVYFEMRKDGQPVNPMDYMAE